MPVQTERPIGEVIAEAQERIRADRQAERELVADLAILTRYDFDRALKGHNYGGGQRRQELNRLERTVGPDGVTIAYHAAGIRLPASMVERAGEPLTIAELRAAWDRVARPRIARLEREGYRRQTPGTRRTRDAWSHTATWLDVLEREGQA